jgi:hypothetical protein
VRIALGDLSGGIPHTVTVTHSGVSGAFYFDFLEICLPTETLPVFPADDRTTLATDWDTDHSIALAPERTAWLIKTLGFRGRANHYVGALWFYELTRTGHVYASGTIQFSGEPGTSFITQIVIGTVGSQQTTVLKHLHLVGDTTATIAKAFELVINNGSTGIWASTAGGVLTIHARAMGLEGNSITISASTNSETFEVQASGSALAGGVNGDWRTDLDATPRTNRAVRDWTRSYFKALQAYGIDVAAAFSMELQHGDPSVEAGIAQRYPDGAAVSLNTPALQTNFSPTSLAYWRSAYLEMAGLQVEAATTPYLQFGEVQWWYFPNASGLTFYDAYTTSTFNATYGRPMHVFVTREEPLTGHPEEAQFLSGLVGNFTNEIVDYVRQSYPTARFEVLYPPDVNNTALMTGVNLPAADWTPAALDCLKTENFSFTAARNLNDARGSILLPMQLGFPVGKSSHLVGIGDYTTPWEKEVMLTKGEGVESVVLFALDQFCLIGYPSPLGRGLRRSLFMG